MAHWAYAHFPSASEFVQAMFDEKSGAFRYLGGYLETGKESYRIEPHNIAAPEVRQVAALPGLKAYAVEVSHGIVPALAWRVEIDGQAIAFSGDTNGDSNNGNLQKLAQGADIFVAHNAVPEEAQGAARALHMPPSVIGRIAAEAKADVLVLSHRMQRTLGREAQTRDAIAASFSGEMVFADDLDCFVPGDTADAD